jgi:hypothetical protein
MVMKGREVYSDVGGSAIKKTLIQESDTLKTIIEQIKRCLP